MAKSQIGKEIQKKRIEKERTFDIEYIKPLSVPLRELKKRKQ